VKKKRLEKKHRKSVRNRNWEDKNKHDFAFTHDLVKHRRAVVKLPETPPNLNPLPSNFEPNATVIAHSKKWAFVQLAGKEQLCLIDERLKEERSTLLAPGDAVLVEFEARDAIVRGVAPRRTKLSRPAGEHGRLAEQVVAANADLLVVVAATVRPPFRLGLVDRFLIAAEVGGVEPILCVNKMDLVEEEPEAVRLYRSLDLRVFLTSCETGDGIGALRDALRGKVSVLAGHSGVGKSSLLNAMDPHLIVHTREVSQATHRGRHATTAAHLYELSGDIRIIDTPGIRALGLWGVSAAEVAHYFPDLAQMAAACRFRNCTHVHEPHCAVLEAVAQGSLSRLRYDSYRRIRASLESETGMTPGRRLAGEQGPPLPEPGGP